MTDEDGAFGGDEERVWLTLDEAMARLDVIDDYDNGRGPGPCVHTFRDTRAGILLGAHWSVEEVRAAMAQYGVEESGPGATALGHGLVLTDERGPVFLATGPWQEAQLGKLTDVGVQPTDVGVQPTDVGVQPTDVGVQPDEGREP